MRHALIMLALAAAPALAFAQGASNSETDTVARIAECMVKNAPVDSQQLTMVIELEQAGDPTGRVRYFATDPSGAHQPYVPCDVSKPALALLEARQELPEDRKGWTAARLVLFSNGKFELHYDYPK